jgi:hypothetical protein
VGIMLQKNVTEIGCIGKDWTEMEKEYTEN